jgi:hypothetical protein
MQLFSFAEFELEPALIVDLRRFGLGYRLGRRARNRHQDIAVQYRSAGLEAQGSKR